VVLCVSGSELGGLVLQVMAEKMKIYSYLHVAKNPYPQDIF
jgi:hypothetical protein